ncbi:hypothetical protein LTR36_001378 [Oleoguttula mirabilis]|uniref:Major facilitator superfamily (MFS) profile domain-containing protein n=1 Tax=Oleoguttula mirabilis TaxID=1507867 RepID=A0AAV9JQ74_9PEZI|nr:hypothetical protein LTR36_001378 [Oleoguttula mirabilis]
MAADREQSNGHSTETSPLLSKDLVQAVEPGDGITAPLNGSLEANGKLPGAPTDGEGLERQPSLEDRAKQYEGMPNVQLKYIIPALAIGVFMAAADQTIIVTSYGKIGSELKALNRTSWIATAYFLTLTSFQPLYGKLSDIFGRKACLLFAYTIFGIGCLCCGLAQNMSQLIAARAFAGIGGGGMTTVVSILLSDVVPLRERGQWQGYLNVIYAAGSSSGAPFGGMLADTIGWRWSFLIQAPLCLAAFGAVFFALHLPKRDDVHWRKKLGRVDFLGAAVLISAVFTLLLALDRGSNVSWTATITVVSIAICIPLFALFVLVETKVAREPCAPGHIIFNRTMFACYLCYFFSIAGWLAALFYLPLYFQVVEGLSATGAGVRLIPSIISGVAGSLAGGYYMRKTGKYYWLTVVAYAFFLVGMTIILLCSGAVVHSTVGIILAMSLSGFSSGIGGTSALIALLANASREDQAVATACSYLFKSLGSVFGISMSATLANQALKSSLASELPSLGLSKEEALQIAEMVRQSLENLRGLAPDVRAIVVDAYAKSTTAAQGCGLGLVAGAAISAWFISEKALAVPLVTIDTLPPYTPALHIKVLHKDSEHAITLPAPVVYINGFPGVGKLTVARALQPMLPNSRILHNHELIDPVERKYARGSAYYQTMRAEYRQARLKPIIHGPELRDTIFIFTDSQSDYNECMSDYTDLALPFGENGGRRFYSVILHCDAEENERRLVMAGRGQVAGNGKLTDVKLLRE